MVHIKKLEMFGFKSFGFKNTTMHLQPGMISISGANGSGKSTVLDAIIFALGENRPKMMRVDRLRSLIPSDDQRGVRMARCSVYFDNSDRKIPVDSDRVKITRELDTKGNNTYYVNDKKTQRGQMLDMLDVANAGLSPLNAVQQGTVMKIAELTPEEKRESIESLVGLDYFDEKKEQAQKQLELADRRLEVALAKMGEIRNRIDELEEERNHKLRYDMLGADIDRLKAISAANDLVAVTAQRREQKRQQLQITGKTDELTGRRSDIRKSVAALEKEKGDSMGRADAHSKAKAELERSISGAFIKHQEADYELKTAQNRISQIRQRLPQIDQSQEDLGKQKASLEDKRRTRDDLLAKADEGRGRLGREIQSLEGQWTATFQEQGLLGKGKIESDKKINRLRQELASAQLSLSSTVSKMQDMAERVSSNTKKSSDLKAKYAQMGLLKGRLDAMLARRQDEVRQEQSAVASLEPKRARARRGIDDTTAILEKADKVAGRTGTRIKTIKSIMHEDYSISKLKENADKLGIHGLVYEMISWDAKYERAMLAAGSDWIKAVVVRDIETLLGLAEYARINGLPKTRMIPYEGVPVQKHRPISGDGVLGYLSNFVKCSKEHSGIKEFLFGSTVLTETRDVAYEASKVGVRAVTLDGELFEPLTAAAVIDVSSKISKLTRLISMSGSVEDLLRSISLLKGHCQKRKAALQLMDDAAEDHRVRLSAAEKRLAAVEQTHASLESDISRSEEMTTVLDARVDTLQKRSEAFRIRSICQESRVESLKQRVAILEGMHSPGEQKRIGDRLERLGRLKSGLEAELSGVMTALHEERSRLASLDARESEAIRRMRALQTERSGLAAELSSLQEGVVAMGRKRDEHNDALIKLREQEQDLISTTGSSVEQLREYDMRIKGLNAQDRGLTDEINSLKRKSDSLSRDLEVLAGKAAELQRLAGSTAPQLDAGTVGRLLEALQTEQNRLQPKLNSIAPEKYLEVSDGYRSMSDRKNSLESERNSIVKFIEDVEKDKRQTFLDAFDRVDQEIRAISPKMMNGAAWLEIQNEDDLFNSGISYMVQLPAKPKRESTSLSGGEKTLAATVFVLALQKLKPSSFYLFDEVDAALDAPNSERLSKILKERSRESQFIIVSLKDSVVQKAGLIYGVYPRNGVSHLVIYKDRRLSSITP